MITSIPSLALTAVVSTGLATLIALYAMSPYAIQIKFVSRKDQPGLRRTQKAPLVTSRTDNNGREKRWLEEPIEHRTSLSTEAEQWAYLTNSSRRSRPTIDTTTKGAKFADHGVSSIAFCVTGQLSRLELDSKIERIIASNAEQMIVHVFMNLDDSHSTNFVFANGEFENGLYSQWNQTQLKRYVSKRWLREKALNLPHGIHLNFYQQSQMNFTVDHMWVRHFNETDGSLDPSLSLEQNLEKRSILYLNQFSSISTCMDQIERYEEKSGNSFDLVARVRDDAYAMDDWILDDSYIDHDGITTLDCQQWGGLHDMTYVVSRKYASDLFHNLFAWRLSPEKLAVQQLNDEEARYPRNPERWLLAVVEALNIPVRRVSICEMPLVIVRFSHGKSKVIKENVGDHILGGLHFQSLGLSKCTNSSFPPFPRPRDPIRQYESRKMINLESAVNNYHDRKSNRKYNRVESKTYFIYGQQCDSCRPKWASKLAQMMQNPLWEFLEKSKMKCISSSDSVCNDKKESQEVSCYQVKEMVQEEKTEMQLPSVQIIGAQKAGTTAIAEWLLDGGFHRPLAFDGEPEHYRKESHFFDLNRRYTQGLDFYAERFQDAEGSRALDATPDTLQFPERVHSIYESVGEGQLKALKIIAVLREPVSRELSLYNHRVFDCQRLPSFERNAWHREVLNSDGSFMTFDEYAQNVSIPALGAKRCFDKPQLCARGRSSRHGLYAFYLKKWFELFDRNQILVLSYDELSKDPERLQERIQTFLGRSVPGSFLRRNSNQNKRKVIHPSNSTKQRLKSIFAPHNDRLYQLLEEYPGPPMEQKPFPHFVLE